MEKALSDIFNFQRFAKNPSLQAVIDACHARPRELSLEEADKVSAAGSDYAKPDDDQKDRV